MRGGIQQDQEEQELKIKGRGRGTRRGSFESEEHSLCIYLCACVSEGDYSTLVRIVLCGCMQSMCVVNQRPLVTHKNLSHTWIV